MSLLGQIIGALLGSPDPEPSAVTGRNVESFESGRTRVPVTPASPPAMTGSSVHSYNVVPGDLDNAMVRTHSGGLAGAHGPRPREFTRLGDLRGRQLEGAMALLELSNPGLLEQDRRQRAALGNPGPLLAEIMRFG